MNLRSVDLNLLVVFDQLLRTRSVTVAAQALAMTPSAVSHALGRLRLLLNDDLLVRTPEGFQPTRRAAEIHANLGDALRTIEWALADQARFDPAKSTRTFALQLSDYVGVFLLPPLCARLRAVAPHVRLHVERHFSMQERDDPDVLQVRVGGVEHLTGYRRETLFDDTYLVLMRADHPSASDPPDTAAYAALSHVKVSPSALGTSAIDDALARRGLSRTAVVIVANWLEAARIVERSDLVAAVPRPWMSIDPSRNGLVQHPLPLPEVRFIVEQCWHPGKDQDLGHRWLRAQVKAVFDERAWAGPPVG